MSDRLRTTFWIGAAATALVSAAAAAAWGLRVGVGILAGGAWNLASLWCLTRLLTAWMGSPPSDAGGRGRPQPSRRRVIGWLLLKFPLLYLVVFAVLRSPSISGLGFGVGFTVVLIAAVGALARRAPRVTWAKSYGR